MQNDYNFNYGYGRPGYYFPPSDGTNWVERIRPDIKNLHRSAKNKMITFIVLVAVCAVVFFSGWISFISTINYNMNTAWVFILGFLGEGVFIPLLIVFAVKTGKLGRIVSFINTIEAQDKINLKDLSKSKNITKDGLILIIRKLIETDNLRGYEIIKNVGVAKIELNAKERDFPQETEGIKEAAPLKDAERKYKCPNCGAAITERTEKFCIYCGTRLE